MSDQLFDILAAYLHHETLTAEEMVLLDEWRSKEENKELYLRLELLSQSCDTVRNAKKEVRGEGVYLKMEQVLLQHREARKARRRRAYLYGAAGIALLASFLLFLLPSPEKETTPPLATTTEILPGSSKAHLQIRGEWIDLEGDSNETILDDSLYQIGNKANTLVYSSHTPADELEYNILYVPRGGEYSIILSDGTKVYLNADSELRYPVRFSANKREVFLTGEAYFEVAHNPESPFIVQADQLEILVRGTSFNVNAYREQEQISTVLEKGDIAVSCDGIIYPVIPGDRLVYHKAEKKIAINQVDTERFTSWKSGYYKFRETTLEDIMTTLSLWYDVAISYQQDSIKELVFTGQLRRFDNIMALLSKFEHTGNVQFIVENKHITIREK